MHVVWEEHIVLLLEGMAAAKRKDNERQLQEKDKEMAEKKLKHDLEKEKEKEMIKQAAKSKKSLEQKEVFPRRSTEDK